MGEGVPDSASHGGDCRIVRYVGGSGGWSARASCREAASVKQQSEAIGICTSDSELDPKRKRGKISPSVSESF